MRILYVTHLSVCFLVGASPLFADALPAGVVVREPQRRTRDLALKVIL